MKKRPSKRHEGIARHCRQEAMFRRHPLAASLLQLFAAGLFVVSPFVHSAGASRGTTPPVNALPVPSSPSSPTPRSFAYAGAATVATDGNSNMVVTTTSRNTGLNWDSFNIGANASVYFGQPDAASRVLNRIWQNDPSVIMGRLGSNGQVYLINQNGILFGDGAQVNVGGLVASALGVSEDLLNKGLPGVRGESLKFAWEGNGVDFAADKGYVVVDPGARITTPAGGRVVLLGAKTAQNAGTVQSDSGGEAIVAAGGSVLLTAPTDPNLRGLLVEVKPFKGTDAGGVPVTFGGTATNAGTLDTGRDGVVTLAALAVNQQGTAKAGKALNINGETLLVSGTNAAPKVVVTPSANKMAITWTSAYDMNSVDRALLPEGKQTVEILQPAGTLQIDWLGGFLGQGVAAGQTLLFTQPDSGAVAYNFVNDAGRKDAAGNPLPWNAGRTTIDGNLTANGQVYLINTQGIRFGSTARVRAGYFVASALGMNPLIVDKGINTALSGYPDSVGYLNSQAFYLSPTAFADAAAASAAFSAATVAVDRGASIAAASGSVLLIGASIRQSGSIRTESGGQVLLAAGAGVFLKPAYYSGLRGFTAAVNPLALNPAVAPSVATTLEHGAIHNDGDVRADFGDISLTGFTITQAGSLIAATSVGQNGSIHLDAQDTVSLGAEVRHLDAQGAVLPYAYDEISGDHQQGTQYGTTSFASPTVGGSLTFASGSVTQVALNGDDGKTTTPDQPFFKSTIDALAKNITVQGGALLEARGGSINLAAYDTFDASSLFASDPYIPGLASNLGTLFIDRGARLDVSGAVADTKVAVDGQGNVLRDADGKAIRVRRTVADLFIPVELRGDQLANNPVQRNGVLKDKAAYVDIRDGVAIADLSAYFQLGQTVEERAASGGSINLMGRSVIVKDGATLDVSGGRIDYAAGAVQESRATTRGGISYRLNDAPTKLAYRGLITATRQEAAYSEGRSAGTVSLSGDHIVLGSNNLLGATSPGPRQRKLGDPLTDRYALPRGAQLVVKDYQSVDLYNAAQGASQAAAQAALDQAALSRQIAFINGRSTLADGLNAGDVAGGLLELSSSLVDHGFSRFDIASAGRVDLPADVSLALAPGGSFKLGGRQVYVAGDVSAPGGAIDLGTYVLFGPTAPSSQKNNVSATGPVPYSLPLYPYYTLLVDRGATLSTAGRWVNDALARSNDNLPALALNGGSIKLASSYDLDLRAGSLLDVSGGGQVQRDGKLVNGNGGSLLLVTGGAEEENYFGVTQNQQRAASLFLDGSLAAYALGKGGSLEVKTSFVTLGATFGEDSRAWTRNQRLGLADKPKQVGAAFSADFLNQGGFYSFSFVGRDGVTVLDGTRLLPTPRNWTFAASGEAASRRSLGGAYRFQPSGSDMASFTQQNVLPLALRGGSTALSLATRSTSFGDLTVGRGAYLGVDPLGSIKLESYRQLTVLGTLEAPAGLIDLSLPAFASDFTSNQPGGKYTSPTLFNQSQSIYLGVESRLLAGGTTRLDAGTQALLERGLSVDSLLARGLYRGQVLAGGTVNLDAGLFYLVSRAGSLIDVGGSADTLSSLSGGRYLAQTQGGAGGDLSLAARGGMFLDGAYRAAGGNGALGGNFYLRLKMLSSTYDNPWYPAGSPGPNVYADPLGRAISVGERQLTLYQSSGAHASLWDGLGLNEGSYLAHGVAIDGAANNGKAALDLSLLAQGGFGSWYLSSAHAMRFSGAIDTGVGSQLRLDAISFNAADNAAAVTLRAASFQLGNYDGNTLTIFSSPSDNIGTSKGGQAVAGFMTPTTGSASFTLAGADIGLAGSFLMNGFGSTRFISDGDIHFDSKGDSSVLKSTGTLEFSAARLAPGTFSDFTVDLSSDAASHIGISRRGRAGSLLSAAGRLEFRAADILHQGTVVAPLGQVVFTGCHTVGCGTGAVANGAVTLGEQSLTSVAADANSRFLLGYTTQGGRVWTYDGNGSQYSDVVNRTITQLPDKAVVVNADRSLVKTGARIDLSGGGEGIAWEFSPGATGKTDILQPSATAEPTVFAIVPGLQGAFAAATADSQSMIYYSTSNPVAAVDIYGTATTNYSAIPSLKAGDQIVLGKNPTGLGGSYTLLPARYALLPGAYLVTVKSGQGNLLQAQVQADGAVLVMGAKMATTTGGSAAYASPMTVELASQSVIQARAKYDIATATDLADRLFAGKDKNFAGDAGRLSVSGRSLLGYDPTVSATHVDAIATSSGTQRAGRGGKVDLAAPNLFVGDGGSAAPDASWVSLDKDALNRQGIASLLLGGTRAGNGDGETITVISDHLQVATTGGTALRGPELLFAARSTLDVAAGSKLEATEEIAPRNYTIDGDGAFLRVAGGGQSGLSRTGVTRSDGNLTVAAGASIAGRSLIFNATLSNTLAAAVALHNAGQSGSGGGSIDIGASRINVVGGGGNGTAPGDGLTLSNATLAPFADADQIRLTSYSTIDLYGNALLGGAGLKSLVLGAAGIAGHGTAGETATLQGNGISFENQNPASASFSPGAALGGGQLAVNAQTVTFDGNASQAMRDADNPGFALRGFAGVTVNAAEEVRFKGLGLTAVDNDAAYAYAGAVAGSPAALTFNTGRVVAMAASDQVIRASGAVGVRGGSTAAPSAELGGRLEMRGQALDVAGRIDATAGRLLLKATGPTATDNVTIGGQLLAEGFRKAFADTYAYAPAGEIGIESANGDVIVGPGAVVSVSAAESGDAGALGLSAKQGTVSAAAGTLRGAAADGSQGRLTADAAHLSLDGLAAAVREGSKTHFQGKWDIRARNDNLRLSDSIKAAAVTLAADRGDIDISGTIDASGTKGGLIQLYANRAGSGAGGVGGVGGNIFLRAGSRLLAYASQSVSGPNQGTAGQGGTIILGVSGSSSDDEAGTGIHAEPSGGGKAAALIDASTPAGSSAAAGQVIFSLPRSDSETPTVTGAVTLGTYVSNLSLSPLKGVSAEAIRLIGVNATSSGTVIALAATSNGFGTLPGFSTYQSGMVVVLSTTATNGISGAATVNVNSVGAVPLVRADGSPFDGTNKVLTNQPLVAVYDGSTGNPTSGKFVVSYIGMAGTGSTATAYIATPGGLSNTRSSDPLTNGMTVVFRAIVANTGAATLNVNGLGAKSLLDEYGKPLASGAIANNDLVIARYDGTAFKLVKDTTSTVLAPSLVIAPSVQAALSGTKTLISSAAAGLYSLTPPSTVAFTLTTNGGLGTPGAYQNGMTVVLSTNNAGLGGAATVNVNGLGAKPVVFSDGSDFDAASKLLLKGQPVVAVYDSVAGKFKVAYVGMADTGTAGAYIVSGAGMSNTPASLTPVNGTVVAFRAGNTNTGTATLKVNALAAKSLKNSDGSALAAGAITAGDVVVAQYNGTEFRIIKDTAGIKTALTAPSITVLPTPAAISPIAAASATVSATNANLSGTYQNGMVVVITPSAAISTAMTVNISTLSGGAKPVKLRLADGSYVDFSTTNPLTANQPVVAVYDSANARFVVSYVGMVASTTPVGATYTLAPAGLSNTRSSDVLSTGMTVVFRANAANTGAATLNVNGLGLKSLTDEYGNLLPANAIAAGDVVVARYDGTQFKLIKDDRVLAGLGFSSVTINNSTLAGTLDLQGSIVAAARADHPVTATLVAERTVRQAGDIVIGHDDAVRNLAAYNAMAKPAAAALAGLSALAAGQGLALQSGLRVVSDGGDITVNEDWDLSGGAVAGGMLTLQAAKNVNLMGTLSDGFTSNGANLATSRNAKLSTSPNSTWSYRLTAGADTAAANPLAVNAAAAAGGNLTVGVDRFLRTGRGSIDLAAAGDVALRNGAAVYTAGYNDTANPAHFSDTQTDVLRVLASGGGGLSVSAGGSIVEASQNIGSSGNYNNSTSAWLVPFSQGFTAAGDNTTQWYPRIASFLSGFATFGGGDMELAAGKNIQNVQAALPTSGKMAGSGSPSNLQAPMALSKIGGGGDLTVRAGGDIAGGNYYVEQGALRLSAGGGMPAAVVAPNSTSTQAMRVAVGGNGVARLTAMQDVVVEGGGNPLMTSTNFGQGTLFTITWDGKGGYSTSLVTPFVVSPRVLGSNTDDAVLEVVAVNGAITLGGTAPSQVKAATLNADKGNILIGNTLSLLPGRHGQVDLLSAAGISFGGTLTQYDTRDDLVPGMQNPLAKTYWSSTLLNEIHNNVSWHADDAQPSRLIALNGNILSTAFSSLSKLTFNEAVQVQASGDIGSTGKSVAISAQHWRGSDISTIEAGGSIAFATPAATAGATDDGASFKIIGPGLLTVAAGKNVDLGGGMLVSNGTYKGDQGIVTSGNLENPYLPAGGAGVSVLAGAPRYDYAGFADFAADKNGYAAALAAFVDQHPGYRNGASNAANNKAALLAMPDGLKASFLRGQFFALLRAYGLEMEALRTAIKGLAANQGEDQIVAGLNASYRGMVDAQAMVALAKQGMTPAGSEAKAQAAIAALFPAGMVQGGDIVMFKSQIKTKQGGGIDLLAPGGEVVVGVANPGVEKKTQAGGVDQQQSKRASDLGLITVRSGDIRVYTRGNFQVNKSRVFTLGGGDIQVWAGEGNIDAGSGAKTTQSTPPPVLTYVAGQPTLDVSNSISGAGIATLKGADGAAAGSLYLTAPKGFIDAGEAGLRSTGNVFLSAVKVLNAANIQAAGTVAGAPPPAAPPPPATGESASSAATKSDAGGLVDPAANRSPRGVLTVEVMGDGATAVPTVPAGGRGSETAPPRPAATEASPASPVTSGGETDERKQRE